MLRATTSSGPAYVIDEVETHDREPMARYREATTATVAAHGGRFIVRAGASETLEGGWSPERIAVLEFPSVEVARPGGRQRTIRR